VLPDQCPSLNRHGVHTTECKPGKRVKRQAKPGHNTTAVINIAKRGPVAVPPCVSRQKAAGRVQRNAREQSKAWAAGLAVLLFSLVFVLLAI